MNNGSVRYTPEAIADLTERTEYETWLLEAVYDLAQQPIATNLGDGLIYPPDGGEAKVHGYAAGCIIIRDWRPKFLEVSAPLVLVTSFKLLDMIIEWVLIQNGMVKTHRFKEKKNALKRPIVFPNLIESRPWLRERLIALYKELAPLRGTVIHDRHFQSTEGTLQVSTSRAGTIGPVVTLTSKDLRNFAVFLVSLFHYLEGSWKMDLFQEKRIRHTLDELEHLHRLPSMGQLPPVFLTVRVYVTDKDPIEINLDRLRNDIATKYPGDVLFEVRIVVVSLDGQNASAYMIGWKELQNAGPRLQKRKVDLANSKTSVPDGINLKAIAYGLELLTS